MKDSKKKIKKFVFIVITLFFILALSFLLLEYGLAPFYYSNVGYLKDKEFDPAIGWILKPGTYWVKPPHSFKEHRVHINRFGLRGEDIVEDNQKSKLRIIILGDSFTFAVAVPEEQIFTTQLESFLKQRLSSQYEVINAGVPGYGNAQELLLMRKLIEEHIIADVYLLMFFSNDILDNLRLDYGNLSENLVQPGFVLDAKGQLELKYPPQKKIQDTLETFIPAEERQTRTKSFEVLSFKIKSLMQTKPGFINLMNKLGLRIKFPRIPGIINGWHREDVLETGIPLMKAILKELKSEAERRNAKLLISMIPSPIQIYKDTYGPLLRSTFPDNLSVDDFLKDPEKSQRIVKSICEELNIPFQDLHSIFQKNDDKVLFIASEGHLTEEGHAIVAHSLSEFIEQELKTY